MAYSPDGQRLATASEDHTVRVWDAATGQELLSLQGHTLRVWGLAYSPDGQRLASAGEDGTVRVWEASTVPDEVWRQRGLVSNVHTLFGELLLREEVKAALRKDRMLSDADREFALEVAQTHGENASALNGAAWNVVKVPGLEEKAYGLALRQAEAADRAQPESAYHLNTLGVAQYRAAHYAAAVDSLTKSEKINSAKLNTKEEGYNPATDLAFLAMAQHQLAKKDEAKATLVRLREVMKQERWAKDAEAQGFLREAEELIEGKPAEKQK
jgi:hypothetical protein